MALATRASRVTHGSAEAQVACALYALIARRLLDGEGDRVEVLDGARRALRSVLAEVGLPGSRECAAPSTAVSALDAFEGWPERRGGGRVVDSFWSAWEAFVAASDYRATVPRPCATATTRTRPPPSPAGWPASTGASTASRPSWHRGLRDRPLAQELADRLVETDDIQWDGTPWPTSRSDPLRVGLHRSGRHGPGRSRRARWA